MIAQFREIRKFLTYAKMWMQRTMSWVAVINSGMILFLVLAKLQDYGIQIYITAWFLPIYAAVILLMMAFGYIEDKAGFHMEESKALAEKNPYFKEILERLERIEGKIGKK